ncbi:MAG: hypothetical protein ABSB60_01670 [Terracidiphilus sp.]
MSYAPAQNVPLISGGAGFFTRTSGGKTSYIPTIEPLAAAPLGSHALVEGRANLLEDFFPSASGYDHVHFVALTYLQMDYLVGAHATIVAGEYLTPFGSYNERLAPIWIGNFQDPPLTAGLGTGTGSSVGGMLRGSAISTSNYSLDYAAFYSAASSNQNFNSQNSWGGRSSIYVPRARFELGASFSRVNVTAQTNNVAVHAWWEPADSSFKLRSEYDHGTHAQGYWIEADYRLSPFGGPDSALGRLEPVFRWQQVFRNSPDPSDGLPSADTQRIDAGLNYHLPHEVRIITSYSRQLSATGNANLWQTGITYRFLFPTWRGR